MEYHWSGNVRQLENVCRWLTVMTASQEIMPQDLPQEIRQSDEKSKSILESPLNIGHNIFIMGG